MLSNIVLRNFKRYVEAGGPQLFNEPGPRPSRMISPLGAYDSAISEAEINRGALAKTNAKISDFEKGGKFDFESSRGYSPSEDEEDDDGSVDIVDIKNMLKAYLQTSSEAEFMAFVRNFCGAESDGQDSLPTYKPNGVPNNAVSSAMDEVRSIMAHIRDENGYAFTARPSAKSPDRRTLAMDASSRELALAIAPGLARIQRV